MALSFLFWGRESGVDRVQCKAPDGAAAKGRALPKRFWRYLEFG